MAVNARWRKDPFTGATNELLIEDEEHTIEYHPEPNLYGFYANEGIVLDTGEPVILVEDTTAQTAFTEIPKTIAPNSGQFRVDYDAEGYQNTAFVNCNAGDVGKNILFTYKGTGTIVHPTFRRLTQFNYAGSVYIEQDLEVDGDVILAASSAGTISASNKKIEDVSPATAGTDAVQYGQLIAGLPFRNYEELTASGTWTKPADVEYVFIECVGGGGGGGGVGSNPGGGGGGASGEHKRDLIPVSGDVSYTIGAGGAGSTTNGSDGSTTTFSTVSAAGGKGGTGRIGGAANSVFSFPGGNGGSAITDVAGTGGGMGGGRGADYSTSTPAQSGVANSGGGGGGGEGSTASAGGNGGSGIIRLWY